LKKVGIGFGIARMLALVGAVDTRVTASPIVVATPDAKVALVASRPALATAPVMLTKATRWQPCVCLWRQEKRQSPCWR